MGAVNRNNEYITKKQQQHAPVKTLDFLLGTPDLPNCSIVLEFETIISNLQVVDCRTSVTMQTGWLFDYSPLLQPPEGSFNLS